MKVALEKDYRKYYTLDDLDRAKLVIQAGKEDEKTAKGWAEYAVKEILANSGDYLNYVISAEAHTAKNCRAWNLYGDESEDMDIWITGLAKTRDGFIEIGAYLSDIWQTGAVPYKYHTYYRYYALSSL